MTNMVIATTASDSSPSLVYLHEATRQVICAHCNTGVVQTLRAVRAVSPAYSEHPHDAHGIFERAWSCDFCNGVVVELLMCGPLYENQRMRELLWSKQLWPKAMTRALEPEVPEGIRDRFAEGSTCESAGALRGAAAMYRAAIEELCKEQGASKFNLHDKIEELRGSLGEEIVRDLHEARMLGNDSVHDGLVYAPEEVADVAELIVEMTEILYVQPARRAALRDARKARRDAAKNPASSS
ncbi:DUF4145 domain-containing protein [Nonomuraea dietziae]|uniref:DUF4145 domain-containing protein n=1 Tax=Nonomuraea dietziae TaxID=65515 RepID=UPI0033C4468A